MPYFYDQLFKAQLENSASDLLPVSTGLIYFNTSTSLIKYYNASVWKTVVDTSSVQTLTFKTLTSPTIGTPTFSSYADFTESASPSAPSSGIMRVYSKSDDKMYQMNSAGVESLIGGGSGSGEINMVENPSDSTNWTSAGSFVISTTATVGLLPLSPLVDTAIYIESNTSGSRVEATLTDTNYYTMTVPEALKNRKLKIEFWMRPSTNFIASEWTVSVYSGSTRMALSTDSAGASYLPVMTGKYSSSFDADSSATYTLRFTRITNGGSNSGKLAIASVVVGPGIQPQGAAVSEWLAYTPSTGGVGTPATNTAWYRRVGDSIEVEGFLDAGTVSAASLKIGLPNSYTIDSTKIAAANKNYLGTATITGVAAGGVYVLNYGFAIYADTVTDGTSVFFTNISGTDASGNALGGAINGSTAMSNGSQMVYKFYAPISQFSGSGTVNLSQTDVEYVFNTSGTTAAGGSDTTAFGYGPTGAAIGNIASTTGGGSLTTMRVRFKTPIQITDHIVIQISVDGLGWTDISESDLMTNAVQSSSVYGIVSRVFSATDVDIEFGNKGRQSNNAAYAGDGATWTGISTCRWRVKKFSGGAAVGFSLASTISSGLVNPYTEGSGVVYAGTYTPSLVNATNVAASTSGIFHYMRVGNQVNVTGTLSIDPTAAGGASTIIRISLPISSDLTASSDCAGGGVAELNTNGRSFVTGNTANDSAQYEFTANDLANGSHYIWFMNTIK